MPRRGSRRKGCAGLPRRASGRRLAAGRRLKLRLDAAVGSPAGGCMTYAEPSLRAYRTRRAARSDGGSVEPCEWKPRGIVGVYGAMIGRLEARGAARVGGSPYFRGGWQEDYRQGRTPLPHTLTFGYYSHYRGGRCSVCSASGGDKGEYTEPRRPPGLRACSRARPLRRARMLLGLTPPLSHSGAFRQAKAPPEAYVVGRCRFRGEADTDGQSATGRTDAFDPMYGPAVRCKWILPS